MEFDSQADAQAAQDAHALQDALADPNADPERIRELADTVAGFVIAEWEAELSA